MTILKKVLRFPTDRKNSNQIHGLTRSYKRETRNMTKQEYIDWIHSAKHIVTDYNEHDSNGNHYARDIFEKDGKFYSVEYINGEVMDRMIIDAVGRAGRSGDYVLKEIEKPATRDKYVAEEII